jgi:sirohydrochlorin cobaltochelatase
MTNANVPNLGWLIVGHGTRDPQGRAEFEETARLLATQTNVPVEACYLELATPTIAEGVAALARRGVRQMVVVPLLLFTAGHAKRDIPDAVAAAAQPLGIAIVGQTRALELEPSLLALSRQRFAEITDKAISASETRLLLVGRGGSDPVANRATQAYTQELASQLGVKGETAFVALAQPTVPDMLAALAAARPKRVVVLPHLLFTGEVLTAIHSHVTTCGQQHPKTECLVAAHLGPHPLLIQALLARLAEMEPGIASHQQRF